MHDLDKYGQALLQTELAMPELLQMEMQPAKELNQLQLDEVGWRMDLQGEEARKMVVFYESLLLRPQSWQSMMHMAGQHTRRVLTYN